MSKVVAVHSSDPTYGDPYEGVFYMKPPFERVDVERHAEQSGRRWVKQMATQGLVMTATPALRGPFDFMHTERRSMDDGRADEQEFVLLGWFKRDRPLILPMDEIARRRELALRYGLRPDVPVVTHHGEPAPKRGTVLADEMAEYHDPSGLNEAGLKEAS